MSNSDNPGENGAFRYMKFLRQVHAVSPRLPAAITTQEWASGISIWPETLCFLRIGPRINTRSLMCLRGDNMLSNWRTVVSRDIVSDRWLKCLEIVSRIRFLSNCRYRSRVNLNVMVHRGTSLLSE